VKPQAVLLDLDGTLLDTIGDLAAAVNAMRGELGLAPLPVFQVRGYVGKGSEILVHRALTEQPDGRVEDASLFVRAMDGFRRHYHACNGASAVLYPGVREGLEAMQAAGLALACVTNKPQEFTLPLLERTGLRAFFRAVVSGDTLDRKKPDPAPLLHACDLLGVAPAAAVAIGDSVNDVLAARAAGCRVFAVPYGYSEGQPVQDLELDAIVGSLVEACERLAGLTNPTD
jgi:phosphoglycolate phosphatase